MTKYLATSDVAAVLGVTLDRIQDWIATGQLAAVNVASAADGKKPRWRISETELDRFLSARKSSAPTAVEKPRRLKHLPAVKEFF